MPEDNTVRNFVFGVVTLLLAAMLVCMVVVMGGCGTTAADIQKVASSQTAITALKISQCVQGALAEEQLELLRQRREQEAADAIEADRLRSTIGVPSSISQEVDKVMRADAGVM